MSLIKNSETALQIFLLPSVINSLHVNYHLFLIIPAFYQISFLALKKEYFVSTSEVK